MTRQILNYSVFLLIVLSFEAKSQCTPQSFTEPGFHPNPDLFDCVIKGQPFNSVIYFQNFDTISGITVEWMRFDSIEGVPCGLSYTLNDPDLTYNSGESGCLLLTGTTNADTGKYSFRPCVTVKVSILPNPISCDNSTILPPMPDTTINYYVRVKDASASCLPTSFFHNKSGCTVSNNPLYSGVKHYSEDQILSISPNPFHEFSEVTFSLEKSSRLKLGVYNLVGQRILSKYFEGVAGANKVKIGRENLTNGMYLFRLESGSFGLSKLLVIE